MSVEDALLEDNLEDVDEVIAPDTPTEDDAPELDESTLKFIQESGGVEYLQNAKDLYSTFEGEYGNFDSEKFLDTIKDLSGNRYNTLAWSVYDRHKDVFASQLLSELGIKDSDIKLAREWAVAGKPSTDPLSNTDLDPDDPKDRAIIELRQRESERAKADQQREAQTRQAKQQQWQEYVATKLTSFEEQRLGLIKQEVSKLNLGTDQLAQEAQEAIEAIAQARFFKDQPAVKAYQAAVTHIKSGEETLAAKQYPTIDLKISHHTAKAAQFIGRLLQAARDTQGAQTQAIQARKDVSPGAATTKVASAIPSNTDRQRGQFTPIASQLERLRALKAEGKLS